MLNRKNLFVNLIVLVLVIGLVGACDVTNTKKNGSNTDKPKKTQPEYSVTSNLESRIQNYGDSQSKKAFNGASIQDVTVSLVAQVDPPTVNGQTAATSYITYNEGSGQGNNFVYVGHKVTGSAFGGGVDLVQYSANNPNNLLTTKNNIGSIQSTNLDIQEVGYSESQEALYVGGAVNVQDADASGSRLSRLTFNGSNGTIDQQQHLALSGNVTKSLFVGNSDVYAVSDGNTLYQYDLSTLQNEQTVSANGASGFRSVTKLGSDIFVLDQSGTLYQTTNNLGSFQNAGDLNGNGSSIPSDGISRVHAGSNGNQLYAALSDDGFRVTDNDGNVLASITNQNGGQSSYVSVSAQQLNNQTRVFAATPTGTIEIFNLQDLTDGNPNNNDEIAQFSVGDVSNQLSNQQINQILVIDGRLFVANSTEGLVVLDVTL